MFCTIYILAAEDRFKKLYDIDNEHLLEILGAINFCVDLLKRDGEYQIPREDKEHVEWILKEYTSTQMKHTRKGEFGEVKIEYMYRLLDGFDKMLQHLGVDAETINAQQQIMNMRTDYHISVRMWNIQCELMRMCHDVNAYMKVPTFNLTYDNKIDYLEQAMNITEKYADSIRQAFTKILEKRKAEIKENSIPITFDEMGFSGRSIKIIEVLHENEEYMKIKEELEELKKEKGFLKKYEKERCKKEERLMEIFREESSKFPVEIQNMTKIEKIMCLSEGAFSIYYESNEQQAYVVFDADISSWENYFVKE